MEWSRSVEDVNMEVLFALKNVASFTLNYK